MAPVAHVPNKKKRGSDGQARLRLGATNLADGVSLQITLPKAGGGWALAPSWLTSPYKCFIVVDGVRQNCPAQWFLTFVHGCAWISPAELWKVYAKPTSRDSYSTGLGWSLAVQSIPHVPNKEILNVPSRLKATGLRDNQSKSIRHTEWFVGRRTWAHCLD